MIAVLEAKRTSLLSAEYWINNILAGVIVGVVALPPAMASPPPQGLSLKKVLCGLAGDLTSLFGGFASTGAIARTATKYSQWCG